MPSLPLLVEPEALEAALAAPGLLILDLSNPEVYARGHIPGAEHFAYSNLVKVRPPAMGLLADEDQLSAAFSAVGLTPETHVVAYDGEGNGRAARLLWTLDVLGHTRLSLLDGGSVAWAAEGRPMESAVRAPECSRYQAQVTHPGATADKDYILSRLGSEDLALLDSRTPAEYQGQDRRAARGGHIPGAVNLNWTDAMDRGRGLRFKPDAVIEDQLRGLGVTPDKEVIVYCQTHHRSAHTYMVLKHLGYARLRGYPGAWSEWGNDPALPVE